MTVLHDICVSVHIWRHLIKVCLTISSSFVNYHIIRHYLPKAVQQNFVIWSCGKCVTFYHVVCTKADSM